MSNWKPHEVLKERNITPDTVGRDLFSEMAQYAASAWNDDESISRDDLVDTVMHEFGDRINTDIQNLLQWRDAPIKLSVFGRELIEENAIEQAEEVARSPVVEDIALMPDGHLGYAMPIGGVAALRNAISPSYIGYDIACRVTVTLLDLDEAQLMRHREEMFSWMKRVTHFGGGAAWFDNGRGRQHPVMDDPLWDEVPSLRRYKPLAQSQLGSSGGGNHFVDLGMLEIDRAVEWLPNLVAGDKVAALMTHSGSRGAGHKLATHYMNEAEKYTASFARGVPKGHAWLDMDTPIGQEYWRVMNLMGKYAQANHHLIHARFLTESGISPLYVEGTTVDVPGYRGVFQVIENHHNFCWRSEHDSDLYIHRKGATPAERGRSGIIPGTSGTFSYLVNGLGNPKSIYSSSHGAGRNFSRREAHRRHEKRYYDYYEENDILIHGVAPDETFAAYKNASQVVRIQEGLLINTVAAFRPVAVVMGGSLRSDDGD